MRLIATIQFAQPAFGFDQCDAEFRACVVGKLESLRFTSGVGEEKVIGNVLTAFGGEIGLRKGRRL